MNPDFVDFLTALIAADARFIVVGAHALAAHGRPRATGDIAVAFAQGGRNVLFDSLTGDPRRYAQSKRPT